MTLDLKSFIKSKNELWNLDPNKSDADFSFVMGSKKVAVHWQKLAPQKRSSSPHAESHEEEFVYIVSGRPHVWINGFIYQLEPGFAVGFPAGTGVAHTFINNTNEDVEMIVLGDRTKDENKCAFPINPELKQTHEFIWWSDYPKQALFGGHDGKVGNLNFLKPWQENENIKDTSALERKKSFSYPGDAETFSEGVRLSDYLSLTSVGVWRETMQTGQRSSWPHAHKVEEEFAVILKGKGRVWLNGYAFDLVPGDCVFFKPGTNVAHVLFNESGEPLEYLGIGQADGGGAEDQVYYPLHPTRNQQCAEENFFWAEAPKIELYGDHPGVPRKG